VLAPVPTLRVEAGSARVAAIVHHNGGAYLLHSREAVVCSVRPIDYDRDLADLEAFLVEKDVSYLQLCRAAVVDNDAYVLVAERCGRAVGVAVVHVATRDDMGWDPDGETPSFADGACAYLADIQVAAQIRNRGIGTALLRETEKKAQRRGKVYIRLHTDEQNAPAHRFYERNGWVYEKTVYPSWKQERATRVYVKKL
jgi:GNAT superfamily N-acetyltransferase